MFDKVNMTITCTTETRERPVVQQAGLAWRRRAAGSIGGEQRQDVLSSDWQRGSAPPCRMPSLPLTVAPPCLVPTT